MIKKLHGKLPHPIPDPPRIYRPKHVDRGVTSLRASRHGLMNRALPLPKPQSILPRGSVPVPHLSNGIGRYTCMCNRLIILRGCSKSNIVLDRWINSRLDTFSKANPQVAIYVQNATGKFRSLPRVYGQYGHGHTRQLDLNKVRDEDEVQSLFNRLIQMDGRKEEHLRFKKHTVNPSIQGYWHPFLNKPLRIPTVCDKPNLKTEQELLQRRLIKPAIVETAV